MTGHPIVRFILIFIIAYAITAYTADHAPVNTMVRNVFKWTVEQFAQSTFQNAFIETQTTKNASGGTDKNAFYLVYGNPSTIKREQDEALQQGLNQYRISSYSIQLFTFQMFTVPVAFLLSLFIASPMNTKAKLINFIFAASVLILIILIKSMILLAFSISNQSIGIYQYSADTMQNLARLISMMSLGFSIMAGFILWLIFGFRNSSLAELINGYFKNYEKT